MGESAAVSSIDAIREFRECLCTFGEDCRMALTTVDMELSRAQQWLTRDRVLYWQAEWKRRNLDVGNAKAELFRRKLSSASGEPPDLGEKKELLRIATRRLHEAEEKLESVKRWVGLLQQAVSHYHGRSRPLGDKLDSALPHALTLLDNMTTALDAYIAMAPPSAPSIPAPSSAAASESGPKEIAS